MYIYNYDYVYKLFIVPLIINFNSNVFMMCHLIVVREFGGTSEILCSIAVQLYFWLMFSSVQKAVIF